MIVIISVCRCTGEPLGTVHGANITAQVCLLCGEQEEYSIAVSGKDFGRVYRALVDAGVLNPSLFPPYRREDDEQQT